MRHTDGSAGDADYGRIGPGCTEYRRSDPRIAAATLGALGGARTILNVGAGAGSYEPRDRSVTAVEPSATMREQRPPELPLAVEAVAETLPFGDGSFEASMGISTVHQWSNLDAGLAEMRRISGALGARSEARPVQIPLNCTDRLNEAYYGRPEELLDPGARLACSAWSFVEDETVARFERRLRADLEAGRWDARHGALRTLPEFDGSLRLVIGYG